MAKKFISILTPCYNEEDNIDEVYTQIKEVMASMPQYDYEHVIIDNASVDKTVEKLRKLAAQDTRVKVIVNMRNFGHIRSPYHAFLQTKGEVVVCLASDLQDPPALMTEFLKKWEEGYKIVLGQKITSEESSTFYLIRTIYYKLSKSLAEVELVEHVTGFGLYDRSVVEEFRKLDDPYPYVRGLICEFGYPIARIPYNQPNRKAGITKNNFYTLFDLAMLGFTSHSKLPLRLATMLGFAMSIVCMMVGMGYLVYKLLYWNAFSVGLAPAVIGLFFFASVQLFFMGMLGEYIGAIHRQVYKRPLVIEKERINF